MANPISATKLASFPPMGAPLVDSSGTMTLWWYNALLAIFQRTGGSSGVSSADTTGSEVLVVANAAAAAAALANTHATSAQNTATSAISSASAAYTAATAANTAATAITAAAALKANNLSDLTNAAVARFNLGVGYLPVSFMVSGVPAASQAVYQPVVFASTLPSNLAGTVLYLGTAPTATAFFGVAYIRGGTLTSLGSFSVTAGSHTAISAVVATVNLVAGDVIRITCPASPDATMANIALTVRLAV